MKETDYLGLTKKSAQDRAEGKNLIFRLIKSEGKDFFSYPEDHEARQDRVCVEIENGKVVKVLFK